MPVAAQPVERVFRALADPTRRHVVAELTRSPASVGELAAQFDMALPSFVQHLRVLESCGVVRSAKQGRVRTYCLVPERLRVAEDWLAAHRIEWERRADRFQQYVEHLDQQDAP